MELVKFFILFFFLMLNGLRLRPIVTVKYINIFFQYLKFVFIVSWRSFPSAWLFAKDIHLFWWSFILLHSIRDWKIIGHVVVCQDIEWSHIRDVWKWICVFAVLLDRLAMWMQIINNAKFGAFAAESIVRSSDRENKSVGDVRVIYWSNIGVIFISRP